MDTFVFLILPFYLQMCKILAETVHDSVQTYVTNQPASLQLRKKFLPLETICEDISRILSPQQQNPPTSEQAALGSNQQSPAEAPTNVADSSSPSIHQKPIADQDTEMTDAITQSDARKESSRSTSPDLEKGSSKSPLDIPAPAESHLPDAGIEPASVPAGTGEDVEMEENKNEAEAAPDGSELKSKSGVIVLDD